MDEVADAVIASKVTVYKYFKDKDNLLRKVNETLYSEYLNKLYIAKESNKTVSRKISDVLNEITLFIASGRYELCIEIEEYNDDIQKDNKKNQSAYKKIILELIDEGKLNKIISMDIKSEYIFYYIDMSVSYYQKNIIYRELMNNNDSFQKEFLDFFIRNIFINTNDIGTVTTFV